MPLLAVNAFNILILLGSIQGFMLAFVFLGSKKYTKKSNSFLAILLIVISTLSLANGLRDMGVWAAYPFLRYMPTHWLFLIPVTLYYFVQFLLFPKYKIKSWEYLLIIPTIIEVSFQIYATFINITQPEQWLEFRTQYFRIDLWMEVLAIVFCFIFLVIIYKKLNNYEQSLLDNFAQIEEKSIAWLKKIILAVFVIWALWAVAHIGQLYTNVYKKAYLYPSWVGMALIIYYLAYATYLRRDIFDPIIEEELPKEEKIEVQLSSKADQHYNRLIAFMELDKMYESPDLNMAKLAEKSGLSKGYLSQILNQKEGKHFFDFVNHYRVEAVKQKLMDPKYDHFSILGVGLDSGFKSKSTFNAVFKKMTGETPSAFKKRQNSLKS